MAKFEFGSLILLPLSRIKLTIHTSRILNRILFTLWVEFWKKGNHGIEPRIGEQPQWGQNPYEVAFEFESEFEFEFKFEFEFEFKFEFEFQIYFLQLNWK